ncbi:hypothetical protein POX_b02108 [Penicillium oxalicum]|uniref:Gamma-glutamylcyclotransferase n=1 Tax=Penicillium oxalicum (strain 114-2 / CGMCC 5302) TaxID=933388 RepID=S7ZJV8_PENO1|nr:hypothetical protein POX_b02108 [Penicillium oxalicum]EPS30895.1 hypothetical protein PDE_05848 [Penicillium oxalicum 114-2]KAI2792074.1 hypothetical protein POX_b02108 [Penicillium oxalicum]
MKSRCRIHPSHSAHPLAIASLPHWRWLICERGYANVLPPPALRLVGSQPSRVADQIPVSGHRDAVLGVLYDMDAGDEKILDGYEGVDEAAEEVDEDTSVISPAIRPREQGEGSYNKWYVEAEVEKWLDEKSLEDGVAVGSAGGSQVPVRVRVLVYVDEEHVLMSRPKAEYIPRMDRAIREAEALGMDGKWLKEVLRKDIPEV